jgi:hypothetical protein
VLCDLPDCIPVLTSEVDLILGCCRDELASVLTEGKHDLDAA